MNAIPHSHYVDPTGPELIGRDTELATLRGCFARSMSGNGNLALIAGEAGLGKTALIHALANEAAEQGAIVLSGGCYDLTATPPYGPWIELFNHYPATDDLPELPDVLKVGTGMGEITSQTQLFEVIRNVLSEVANVRPTLLVLEDIHWSDPASLSLLRYLGRQARGHRLLIVATYRDDEVVSEHLLFELLPVLIRETDAERVNLRPFNRHDIRRFLAGQYELNEHDTSRLIDYLGRHADGNPLYLFEILRSLEDERRLTCASGQWQLGDLSRARVPPLLLQMIERRMDRIEDEHRRLLEVAAVIGQEAKLDLWQSVSGASDDLLAEVVDRCEDRNLLAEGFSGTSVVFSHSLVREALYQRISLLRRRRIHRRIAEEVMNDSLPDEDIVAHHLQQAGDERAVDWVIKAGERAQRTYALITAADRYARAADLLKANDSRANERGWLLYRAARQLRFSDLECGLAYFEEAEQIGRAVGDDILAAYSITDRGYLRGASGDIRGAIADIKRGNEALEALPPDHFNSDTIRNWVADVVLRYPEAERDDQGFMDQLGGRFNPRRASRAVASANVGLLADAVEIGEPYREKLAAITDPDHHILSPYADTCHGLAIAYSFLGKPEMAKQAFDETLDTLERIHHRALLAPVLYSYVENVVIPYQADQLTVRQRLTNLAEEAARNAHDAMMLSSPEEVTNFKLLWIEGRWNEAREKAPLALRAIFREFRKLTEIAQGRIARATGDSSGAWEYVSRVLPKGLATEPLDLELHPALEALQLAANLALDNGTQEDSRRWIDVYQDWLEWSGTVRGRAEGELLEARYSHANGDAAGANQHADRALAHASSPRQPLSLIEIYRFLGELDTAAERFERAEHHLAESLRLGKACAAPYEAALTNLALAEMFAVSDRPDDARALLDVARNTCSSLRAIPAVDRIDSLSQHLEGTGTTPAGLTPREVEVLRLVARGLSDPEVADRLFVSRRTVNTHLTSIYNKLGVNSRTAAAMVAREHELV